MLVSIQTQNEKKKLNCDASIKKRESEKEIVIHDDDEDTRSRCLLRIYVNSHL